MCSYNTQNKVDRRWHRGYNIVNVAFTILNEKRKKAYSVLGNSKEIKYRDLTGPEKVRLFTHMDIAEKFPALSKAKELGKFRKDFFVTSARY